MIFLSFFIIEIIIKIFNYKIKWNNKNISGLHITKIYLKVKRNQKFL